MWRQETPHWLFNEHSEDTLCWRNSQPSPPWPRLKNVSAESFRKLQREPRAWMNTRGWYTTVIFTYNSHRRRTDQCPSGACLWGKGGTWRTHSLRYRGARAAGARSRSLVISTRTITYIKVADIRPLWRRVLATDTNSYHQVRAGSPALRKADLACIITIHRWLKAL